MTIHLYGILWRLEGHFRNGADAFLLAHPLFSWFSSLAFSLYLGENNSKLMVAILMSFSKLKIGSYWQTKIVIQNCLFMALTHSLRSPSMPSKPFQLRLDSSPWVGNSVDSLRNTDSRKPKIQSPHASLGWIPVHHVSEPIQANFQGNFFGRHLGNIEDQWNKNWLGPRFFRDTCVQSFNIAFITYTQWPVLGDYKHSAQICMLRLCHMSKKLKGGLDKAKVPFHNRKNKWAASFILILGTHA